MIQCLLGWRDNDNFLKVFPYYYSMMKKLALLFFVFIPLLGNCQVNCDDIVGVWLTEIKDAKIEIYKKGQKYYGKVVWLKTPNKKNGQPVKDIHNPNEAKKSRPIMGLNILTDLVFKDNEWSGGKIYDPKNGESYDCKIWLEDGKIKLRGYLGWFYDTKTWTKV